MSSSFVDVATVLSPIVTILVTMVGWVVVFKDSRGNSARAEVYDVLTKIVQITIALNQRSADFLFNGGDLRLKHRAWVASVNVDIASLRALASILNDLYGVVVPDDFYYAVRKNYTLDAEKYSDYSDAQVLQKISDQNSRVSRSLKVIYKLYPAKTKLLGFI